MRCAVEAWLACPNGSCESAVPVVHACGDSVSGMLAAIRRLNVTELKKELFDTGHVSRDPTKSTLMREIGHERSKKRIDICHNQCWRARASLSPTNRCMALRVEGVELDRFYQRDLFPLVFAFHSRVGYKSSQYRSTATDAGRNDEAR